MNLATIRRELRDQRCNLSQKRQQRAGNLLTNLLIDHLWFRNSQRIGFYLASDGEIDPADAMTIAMAAGKDCFLPILHPLNQRRLYFASYQPQNPLKKNRFGIFEPLLQTRTLTPVWSLNLLLLPLVAFDRLGTRLGMGGGFYDRTLSFKRNHPRWGPKLLGLAHSFQEIQNMPRRPWDIPLDGVVTDREFITF